MSKWLVVVLFSFITRFPAMAAEGEYAVSRIAAPLLHNAHAVLRLDEQRFEIIHTGKAIYKNHYFLTIL